MLKQIKIALKKTLPLSFRRRIGNLCFKVMRRIQGKGSHKNWERILGDDVYLVSYPRSGNTWLRNIMTNLRFPDAAWDLRSMAVAFPEVYSEVAPETAPRPRWIKSHDGYNASYPKVIYLIRDGRDVAVSYYHWSGANEFQSFEKFLEETVLELYGNGSSGFEVWHKHVSGWLEHRNDNMLVVNYENLLSDSINEIQRICSFLEIKRDDHEIEVAMTKSTYEKQQKDFKKYKIFENKSVGVKAGEKGWKKYFDSELLDRYWKVAGDTMEKSGYER